MKDELTEEQTQAILKALDKAIANGPWEESNFLRVIGKNLREIRSNFANQLGYSQAPEKDKTKFFTQRAPRGDQQEVFVSLYSSDGNQIQSWERIVANLPQQIISRPIYNNEESVKQLIKSKENKANEAYVAVYINPNDILTMVPDKVPLDKLGVPLLSLKNRSINLENITRFVHLSGSYHFIKGRLIRME